MILNTTIYGPADGVPLLAIHGVTGHGPRYRRLAEEGLPDHRVVAVDLRGHGQSGWDPPWHIEQHIEDLIETLDASSIGRSTVLGHSFGGCLGAYLAAAAPERVEDLIMLDPAIGLTPALAGEHADDSLIDESWGSVQEALDVRTAGQPPHALRGYEEDVAARLERSADGRYRFRFNRATVVTAFSEMARPLPDLTRFGGRILLVAALQAPYVTTTQRTWLAESIGERATIVDFDCDHMVYWEAFEDTVAAIKHFLPDDI